MDWTAFWDAKASASTDFQATGRGLMDVPGYLHTVAEVVRLLELRQGERLADVGCGAGLISLSLAPWLEHIEALDISPALVERARGNLSDMANVRVRVGSLTALPLASDCVDKLLAYSVLQYLLDEAALGTALCEVARVLKPGGRALLAANPDPARRGAYEAVVHARPDPVAATQELALQQQLLWLPQARLIELAEKAGLRAWVADIHPRIWQHFYMFDLIVEKPVRPLP